MSTSAVTGTNNAQAKSNICQCTTKPKRSNNRKVIMADTDGFNIVMIALAKDRLTKNKSGNLKTANAVQLAEQFHCMGDALGSAVKATYNCSDFIQFLDKSERRVLKRYKKEMGTSGNESTSDSD